jgi:catechol 2,3-dioxygenase-like lactoylglutathione lyase family enzyme
MLNATGAFSGFSVDDLEKAKDFYGRVLGLKLERDGVGIRLQLPGGGSVFSYSKKDHQPATFTILNFQVGDIDAAVDYLTKQGVRFEHYTDGPRTDAKGILRGKAANLGPDIAWFKDPAGNFLAVLAN